MKAAAADWPRDLDEIAGRLREHAAELVQHLRGVAPNKALSDRRTVRFGTKGGLAVDIDGPNKGRITDYNDGGNKAQSPLQFIQAEIGGSLAGAVQWARAWLGIEGECPAPLIRAVRKPSPAEVEREEAERRAKVEAIAAGGMAPHGTPAETYLRQRGITAALPAAVRWRPKAWGQYGAVLLLATDAAGGIKAVQQVYVTAEGAKAPLKVQKRSNGLFDGAAVRLAGTAPLTLAEGPETALSVWQATGCETWAALGGIGKLVDQVPAGTEVVIARDADAEGSTADQGIWRAVDALVARGCRVRLACPPRYADLGKTDFNDVLRREGGAAIRSIVATAKLFGGATPHYPAVALPIDQAKGLLTDTVRNWVAHAVTRAEGDTARQVGVKGAAGIGKSRAVLHALQARPAALERHIDILVPQHRLADEMAQAAAGGPLRVQVIRGREYELPDGTTMCAKAAEARQVARAGFNVQETMCRRVDPETGQEEVCEFHAGCPYAAQLNNPEPAVRIMAHEHMFLPRNSGLPKPQAVVIDESFHAKAVRQSDFALDRLTAGLPWRMFGRKVDPDDLIERDRIGRAVRRALEAGEHPRDHGITAEDCRLAAKLEFGGRDAIGITPGMPHAAQRKKLDGYRRSEALKLYRFWKILEAEIERTGPLRQIELRRDVIRRRGDEACDRVYLNWRRDLILPDVPVLVLDADLDPIIGAKFLPRLEVVNVPVDRQAEVVQVQDTACSRQKLLAWDSAPDDQVSRAANRLADVQALLNVEAANGARVLVVTYKQAAEGLKVPAGCAVEWFGNIRGVDRYKHFDTVIVAGREQPPMEAQARALFADDAEPLNLTGGLIEQERTYRMRDGSHATAKVQVHADARVQALLEQVREREMGQAIDRLRLIHRPTPARVLVLTNVVLDVTIDRLTTWKEIMPTRFEQAAARGHAVPLSASELARCFPDLWATAKAAERDELNTPKSYIEVLIRKRGYLNARYRRAGQRGRPTPALIRSDPENARAALEAVVGPVVWFEVEAPDMVRLEAPNRPPVEFGRPVLTVVPFTMPDAEEAARLRLIVGQADKLADLSARLESAWAKFRPPDLPEQVPRRAVQ
jgi:hypothetical protein